MNELKTQIELEFNFDAAHRMDGFGEGHPNGRLHGHTYWGRVTLEGRVDPMTGFVVEYEALKTAVAQVVKILDHRLLNEIEELGPPSSENLARFVFTKLRAALPQVVAVSIRRPNMGFEARVTGVMS